MATSQRSVEVGIAAASSSPLTFGIYPGGMLGDPEVQAFGNPDDPGPTNEALRTLQPAGRPFLVRAYLHYLGPGTARNTAPADVEQYLKDGRTLDLVLCYRPVGGSVPDWTDFVRASIRRYDAHLTTIQIAEEPNSTATGGDGGFAGVRQAVVAGVLAARDESKRLGHAFQVGFNAVPSFDPNENFWSELGSLGRDVFPEALDYVGLDFFPDVFRPVAADGAPLDLCEMVTTILQYFRNANLATAGIPASIPIHITEHGWPTGPDRSYSRQSTVLEIVIKTVYRLREELNITHYEHFDLRDADSSAPDLFHQFGILRDDYTPKPAFETFRRLIAELG